MFRLTAVVRSSRPEVVSAWRWSSSRGGESFRACSVVETATRQRGGAATAHRRPPWAMRASGSLSLTGVLDAEWRSRRPVRSTFTSACCSPGPSAAGHHHPTLRTRKF